MKSTPREKRDVPFPALVSCPRGDSLLPDRCIVASILTCAIGIGFPVGRDRSNVDTDQAHADSTSMDISSGGENQGRDGGKGGTRRFEDASMVDPHQNGFGRNRMNQPVKSPPPYRDPSGILCVDPRKGTRVEIVHGVPEDGVGERIPSFTNSCPNLGFDRTQSPVQLPTPRFANLRKFLGHFARSRSIRGRECGKSYAQAVKDPPIPAMVFPEPYQGGGRGNETTGRGGGGRGRDGGHGGGGWGNEGGRSNVWNRWGNQESQGQGGEVQNRQCHQGVAVETLIRRDSSNMAAVETLIRDDSSNKAVVRTANGRRRALEEDSFRGGRTTMEKIFGNG